MATEAELLKRAHDMRRKPTEPEKRLWRSLSNGQLGGFKFRRQHVVLKAQAIVDFFCPAIGLCVKVDGDTHDDFSDALRDGRLANHGFWVERFTNVDVMSNIGGVAQQLLDTANGLPGRWRQRDTPPPQPLPWRGGA